MNSWIALGLAASLSLTAGPGHAALAISNLRSLAFGTFAAGKGGTVSVAPDGTRSKTGGVTLLSIGTATPAAFLVSDDDPANAMRAYTIILPDDGEVEISNGSTSIPVTNFVSSPAYQGRLTEGAQILRVGATLQAERGLPPGDYAGTFSVTVIYQ